MERHWKGLDFLRGLGIFCLILLHAAFYYYDGLWDLDLDNPPLVITVIGFLLMFAGLFAMISGAVHAIGIARLAGPAGWPSGRILRKKLVSAVFILVTAYLYFLFTGPGLADFAARRMDNSLLVEAIRHGRWTGFSLDRVLYVDSLVMIGTNVLLVSLVLLLFRRFGRMRPNAVLVAAAAVMAASLARIPLYGDYLDALADGRWGQVLLLNWLVNKNNPILPYLAFGLAGAWIGLRLYGGRSLRPVTWTGILLFLSGMAAYVFLPDTMLQRSIDAKWYSIMTAQLGLFCLMIRGATALLDRKPGPVTGFAAPAVRFLVRFGQAGLTAFFWESIVAALAHRLLVMLWPGLSLSIPGALLFGLVLALLWGFALMAWEKAHYVGSVEHSYGFVVSRLGADSAKARTLRGDAG